MNHQLHLEAERGVHLCQAFAIQPDSYGILEYIGSGSAPLASSQ
jgi:hypothetical protein